MLARFDKCSSESESMVVINPCPCLFLVKYSPAHNMSFVLHNGCRRPFPATIANDPLRRSAGMRSSNFLLSRSRPRRSWLTPSQRFLAPRWASPVVTSPGRLSPAPPGRNVCPSFAGSRTIPGRCTGGRIANLFSEPHAGFGRTPLLRFAALLLSLIKFRLLASDSQLNRVNKSSNLYLQIVRLFNNITK